jgi:uncharacterized phage protein (TIGR01671 family)
MKKRECLFRAKRLDNYEWVKGNLLIDGDDAFIIKRVTEIDVTHNADDETELITTEGYQVYPETVGEFTGAKDEAGREIYEGDICRDSDSFDSEGNCDIGVVKWNANNASFYFAFSFINGFDDANPEKWITIIGNIHDNPELLDNKEEK